MNAMTTKLVAADGREFECQLIEAANPSNRMPCIYAGLLGNGVEIGAVRFLFPVVQILSVRFDWPQLFLQAIRQIGEQHWVEIILQQPGVVHESTFNPSA